MGKERYPRMSRRLFMLKASLYHNVYWIVSIFIIITCVC